MRVLLLGFIITSATLVGIIMPTAAFAHASDQILIMLLPTDIYVASGVIVVAVTILLVAVLPGIAMKRTFGTLRLPGARIPGMRLATSLLALSVFVGLIWIGINGPRDPLGNLLPLAVWTVFWIALVTLQAIGGNLWYWFSPWHAVNSLGFWLVGSRPLIRLPRRLDCWPAVVGFLAFGGFLLADPAPADPDRLAVILIVYGLFTTIGLLVCGRAWLVQIDPMSVMMRLYAKLAIVAGQGRMVRIGLTGWQVADGTPPSTALACFAIFLLATGSFDGLNETFWWLGLLKINPLEFPGRSAIVLETLTGLVIVNLLLLSVFALAVWLGLLLVRRGELFWTAFRLWALSLVPIALGYHVGHYLPTFLVDIQYVIAALSDPLAEGDDFLNLGRFYVTTGFFNTTETVRVIWLSQAGAVVIGHMLSVMLAHALATRLLGTGRSAAISQIPLSALMIAYTQFGLWLLASPRGA